MRWFGKEWYKIGYLQDGSPVYCSESGEHCKIADYEFMVELTEEEKKSILP